MKDMETKTSTRFLPPWPLRQKASMLITGNSAQTGFLAEHLMNIAITAARKMKSINIIPIGNNPQNMAAFECEQNIPLDKKTPHPHQQLYHIIFKKTFLE